MGKREYGIRQVVVQDSQEFYRLRLLGLESYPTAFGEDAASFKQLLPQEVSDRITNSSTSGSKIFGAFANTQLVGIGCLRCTTGTKMKHRASIWGLITDPDHQRQGIARMLMEALLEYAKTIEDLTDIDLAVNAANQSGIALYESLGFRIYGTDPARLKIDGVFYDEFLMVRSFRK